MSAQDKAFALMASQAGLLSPETLARAQQLRSERSLDQPIPQVLVSQNLLHPHAVTSLLREVIRAHYVCERCAHRLGYDQLGGLSHLICPACGGGLIPERREGLVSSVTSGVGTIPSSSSTRLPAAADPNCRTRSDDASDFATAPLDANPGWDGKATVVEKGRRRLQERSVTETQVGAGPAQAPPPPARPARSKSSNQRTLGEYTLIKELGRGSNGVVYLAKRKGLQRRFALKVLLDAEFADEESIKRFRLEAAIASKLNDPGVVTVFDVGRTGNHHYYAMDFCEGPTLRERIKEGPLPAREAAEIITKLCRTLSTAHRAGVLHRDLKPANIILSPTHPRITDFGLAQDHSLQRSLTKTGDILGTPFYMAPELFRLGAKGLDHRADLYALGVILYECLSGRRPFSAPTPMLLAQLICHEAPAAISAHVPGVPDALESICLQAMSKRPDDRYVSAQEMADDLELFLRGDQPRARSKRRRKIALPKLEKRKLAIASLAAAGVLLPIAAWVSVSTLHTQRRLGQALELLDKPNPTRDELLRAEQLAQGAPELEARAEDALRAQELTSLFAEATSLLEREPLPYGEVRVALGKAAALVSADADRAKLQELRRATRALEAAASAHALASERAGFRELVTMAFERAIAAADDPNARARLKLERLGYYFNHGAYEDVLDRGRSLQRRTDRIGFEADLLCALALHELEHAEDARAAFKRLSLRDPSGAVGAIAGACERILSGDIEGGLELAERARRLAPQLPAAIRVEGFCALYTGDKARARRNLELLELLAPHRPGVLRLRKDLAFLERKPEDALAAMDDAVLLTEPHPPVSVLRDRAEVYFLMGEREKALPDLERALRRNPDDVHALMMRGIVRETTGDKDDAARDLRKSYRLDPNKFEELLRRRIPTVAARRALLDIAKHPEPPGDRR